jgi:hypothetical protein
VRLEEIKLRPEKSGFFTYPGRVDVPGAAHEPRSNSREQGGNRLTQQHSRPRATTAQQRPDSSQEFQRGPPKAKLGRDTKRIRARRGEVKGGLGAVCLTAGFQPARLRSANTEPGEKDYMARLATRSANGLV